MTDGSKYSDLVVGIKGVDLSQARLYGYVNIKSVPTLYETADEVPHE